MDDFNKYKENLANGVLPSFSEIKRLCSKAKELLLQEPNVLNLDVPFSVCGDMHGQLPDLLEIFKIGGNVPIHNYLFLGDYVDRGYHSTETFLYLLCLKVKFPKRIYLLRGNHETKDITQVYGFYDEVLRKFGSVNVWKECLTVFESLPICAVISGTSNVFCVHGGLSPVIHKLDEIRSLNRFHEELEDGLLDLVWSDPEESIQDWEESPRGAGQLFGHRASSKFLEDNDMDYIARAHQLVLEGYKWQFDKKVLTVWSAPNYCYRCGNVASIYDISDCGIDMFTIFEAAPFDERKILEKLPLPAYF